jgi:hypothetical protein
MREKFEKSGEYCRIYEKGVERIPDSPENIVASLVDGRDGREGVERWSGWCRSVERSDALVHVMRFLRGD